MFQENIWGVVNGHQFKEYRVTFLAASLSYPPIQKQEGLWPAWSYSVTTSICLSNPGPQILDPNWLV
jgi:hypothetical protein